MSEQILNGEYVMVRDSVMHDYGMNLKGFLKGDLVTLIELSVYDGTPKFRDNKTGEELYVSMSSLERVGLAVFDDDLDNLIGTLSSYTIPTEHRPRDNTNFTLTINEKALNDDIPFIIDAYYTANLSLRETGSLLGVDEATIRRRMKKHGVPTRTVSQALRAKYSL